MDFELFMPIEKVDTEKRMVWGYASTPAKDLQGEIVTLDAIKAALPEYMEFRNIRVMHTNKAVGSTVEATVNKKGLYIGAKIRDDETWKMCQETSKGANDQVYRGFSIGGSKLAKAGDTITELRLTEISLVDRPANTECKIDFAKCAGDVFFPTTEDAAPKDSGFFQKAMDSIVELAKLAGGAAPSDGGLPLVAKVAPDPNALSADELADLTLKLAECDFEKREFTDKQRKHLASSGMALPDGSFPISNEADLKNAVQAVGRAADYGKAKAHIIARAKALNCTQHLPADWPGSTKQEKTMEPTDIQKRVAAATKGHIEKAKMHLQKAMDCHGKACGAYNEMAKCMGKADGASETKHMKALGEHLTMMADHHDLAMHSLGKAETAWKGQDSTDPKNSEGTEVPKTTTESIKELPQFHMTEGEVAGSTFRGGGDSPYAAGALAAEVAKAVAAAMAPVNEKLAATEKELAFNKGQMAVLERQPSGGARPRMFGGSGGYESLVGAGDPTAKVNEEICKAYRQINVDDPDATAQATARIIGLRAANPKLFAKSITDPEYKGSIGRDN